MTPPTPRVSRGDLVLLPDGRETVAVSVSDDETWFSTPGGAAYFTSEAQPVPLSPVSGTEAAA